MKTKTVGKMATALMVLLMVLSSVMVMHTSVRAEAQNGTIEGVISAGDGSIIPAGFDVILKDVSDDEVISHTTPSKGGHFYFSEDDVDIGYYKIMIPSQNHGDKAYFENETMAFSVESGENEYREVSVPVKSLDYTINGTIQDENGDPVFDASVSLVDGEDYSSQADLMSINNDTESFYEVKAYNGDFTLKADSPNLAPNISYNMNIAADTTHDITLREGPLVSGSLRYMEDSETKSVTSQKDVTLINQTNGDIIHTVSASGSSWFGIEAQKGQYKLIVNSEGFQPYIRDVTIPDNKSSIQLGKIFTDPSDEEMMNIDLSFGEDWEMLTIDRERTLQPDSVIPGLDYSYLGSWKMQMDMLGNGDWTLDDSEIDHLVNGWLDYREGTPLSTQNFVDVDNIPYQHYSNESKDFTELYTVSNDVTDFSGSAVTVSSQNKYMEYENISAEDKPRYLGMTIKNDRQAENFKNYTYNVELPTGFERVQSANDDVPSGVEITGATNMEIDPYDAVGETSELTLDIRETDPGSAEINPVNTEYVHPMENETLVKKDENVTFKAKITEDPVGEVENYSWSFKDSSIEKYGEEITHNFSEEGEGTLSVDIDTGGGDPTTAELNLTVDGSAPSGGSITADNTTVEERTEVLFTAEGFTDTYGNISTYEWNFTEETPNETLTHPENNITYEFGLKGAYEVRMTVSDVVGNKETYTQDIDVTDATDPVPKFNLTLNENGEEETYTSEDMTVRNVVVNYSEPVTLNAASSFDPEGFDISRQDVDSVNWTIKKDDKPERESTEMIIDNYTFEKLGTYTIQLNVSDGNGNSDMISRTLEVDPGAVPELGVTNLTVSGEMKDGNTVTVKVNVTNYGDGDAEMINVAFKVGDGDSNSKDDLSFYKAGEEMNNSVIPSGDYRVIKFDWSIDGDGKKTISVNVTDSNEPNMMGYRDNNEMQQEVDIEPPMWREYLVYILVPVIIIGVTVGLYYYRERFM